ncbi:MAG: hypothetical protein MJZ03_01240 [archaeon]|nr:hypothetical protein [archaeon]
MSSIVYLKNRSNGKTYAYLNESEWDSVAKKCRCRRKCIGHLDPVTGDIVPNRKKSEHTDSVVVDNIGLRLFLGALTTDMGLRDVIRETFPDNWKLIMTVVYYILDTNQDLSRIRRWSLENITPYGKGIKTSDIDAVLRNITENDLMNFFGSWRKKIESDRFYIQHISSKSDLHREFGLIEYFYNSDAVKTMTNVSVFFDEKSSLPIAMSIWDSHPHSMTDLDKRKNDMLWLNMGEPIQVLDTDFCNASDIDMLLQGMKPFVMKLTHDYHLTVELIDNVGDRIMNLNNRIVVGDEVLFSMTFLRFINGHKCFVHVFYSTKRAESEFSSFLEIIEKCQKELEHKIFVPHHLGFYNDYFVVKDENEHRYVEKNGDEIMKYGKVCGFTVMISNTLRDPDSVYGKYVELQNLKIHYEDLMNEEDRNSLKLYNSTSYTGRIFIQFLSSIVYKEFRNRTKSSKVIRNMPFWNIMHEIKNIHRVTIPGTKNSFNTDLNSCQRELMRVLNISRSSVRL